MAYCARCGKKNEDDARFCNGCGAPLGPGAVGVREQRKDECNDECSGRSRKGSWFWAIIVILVGLWIILQFGVSKIQGVPPELTNLDLWWIFPIIIGIVVIVLGVSMLRKQAQAK